jgi:cobalt-zinc-cadmium efflux system membrane fusion protein
VLWGIVGMACLVGTVAGALLMQPGWKTHATSAVDEAKKANGLRRLDADSVFVPPEVAETLGLETTKVAPARPRPLAPLSGTLALDSNLLTRVHARFPGEVVALGTVQGAETDTPGRRDTADPALRYGDQVRKGQLLAVLRSKDLGEKKSELVDAVSRLRLDQDLLNKMQQVREAVPERALREAERNVESDLIAVARAERTLGSWGLSAREIDKIRAEADRGQLNNQASRGNYQQWARVEIRATQDGLILEKNVAVGDLVDTSADLFKIADVSRLVVWAHAYEEDLALLQRLPKPIAWTVRLPSRPGVTFKGELEQIGEVIDPNQHTALVSGQVDNRNGELKVGQFVTVTLEVPASGDEVEVPVTALVDDRQASLIFVQTDPREPRFAVRKVRVVRRGNEVVWLSPVLRPGNERWSAGMAAGAAAIAVDAAFSPRPGDLAARSGAVLLKGALEDKPAPRTD